MAEACGRDEWARTTALMALIANVNRDPKRCRAFRPSDFDPYACPEHRRGAASREAGSADISVLKDYFMGSPRRAARKGSQS